MSGLLAGLILFLTVFTAVVLGIFTAYGAINAILFLFAGALLAATGATSYSDAAARWRADYEASLKAPGGWLSVAGLFWLHEGDNKLDQGVFTLTG